MRYLIAPNAFKGTIPAWEAARLIASKIKNIPEAESLIQPIADGGDGTCDLLIESMGLEKVPVRTLNAVGQPVLGYFGWDPDSRKAFLDISTASGIGVLEKSQRDPFVTSTYGTGLVIRKAIEYGAQEIVLGLGGSATVDMGLGILAALGVIFLDQNGRELPMFSSGYVGKIRHIQRSPQMPKASFTFLCDVRNIFFGPSGAVYVFGPQKGLSQDQLPVFQESCNRVFELLLDKSKRDWTDQAGYGAAGGVAMGLQFFFPSEIKFGAGHFFELVNLEEKVRWSDWIITGEGQYDSQSDQGKASFEILRLAKAYGKKAALITSGRGGRDSGFDLVLELPDLDFKDPRFRETARENLLKSLDEAIVQRRLP